MARPNSNARGRDMLISLLVIMVPVVGIYWFLTRDPEPQVERVDVAPVLARAEQESPYPVLRATHLPDDWVPTRVAWARDGEPWITNEPAAGNSWQLGYLAPNHLYIAVQQRDRSVANFVSQVTREGRKQPETSELGNRSWERWTSDDGRTRSLVWRDGDMVAVVTGDTDWAQLEAFAGSLTTGQS